MKLTIELVPRTSWYNNVRSNVSKERWDELRFDSYAKAKHHCEICGETGKEQGYEHDVDCEEKLVLAQLMKVNGMDEFEANNYLHDAFLTWDERSVFDWTVDLTYLSVHQDQLGTLLAKMNKFRKN